MSTASRRMKRVAFRRADEANFKKVVEDLGLVQKKVRKMMKTPIGAVSINDNDQLVVLGSDMKYRPLTDKENEQLLEYLKSLRD